MSLSIPLTIAITAHRDLVESEIPGIRSAIREFLEDLMDRYPGVPLRLLSPLAEGGGRIAAQVALELGLELVVPLPFAVDEYERDFSDAESVSEFRSLCAQGEVLETAALEHQVLERELLPEMLAQRHAELDDGDGFKLEIRHDASVFRDSVDQLGIHVLQPILQNLQHAGVDLVARRRAVRYLHHIPLPFLHWQIASA